MPFTLSVCGVAEGAEGRTKRDRNRRNRSSQYATYAFCIALKMTETALYRRHRWPWRGPKGRAGKFCGAADLRHQPAEQHAVDHAEATGVSCI